MVKWIVSASLVFVGVMICVQFPDKVEGLAVLFVHTLIDIAHRVGEQLPSKKESVSHSSAALPVFLGLVSSKLPSSNPTKEPHA